MGWTCSGCGGENPAATAFCGHCGARRTEQVAEAPGWQCRSCGAGNPSAAGFCGGCGSPRAEVRAEELRTVTALFADISGFTTLADTLDVEDLHEVIAPVVAGLAEVASRYEGFIEKYAGDALLVLFGAPVTHEDDPQRALLAALDMHDTLPRLLERVGPAGRDLTIHVGVNTGRVLAGRVGSAEQGDYAVLGDSVILAQRLESVCPPGQTYVGASTYALTRDEFAFEDVGELRLKGKLAAVRAHRLLGPRQAVEAATPPLAGRAAELAVVDDVLGAVGAGRGATLLVTGEPGAGKSRLLLEARSRATALGVRWLAARSLSYGAALPYWPLADLLRQVAGVPVGSAPDDLAQRLPPEALPAARRLLGLDAAAPTPEQARREVHDAVVAWLRATAEHGPVVLCVEDVHWADAGTLDVLAEVVRLCHDVPLAVVLSSRPDGRPRAVEALGNPALLEVGPLDAEGVHGVAAAALGGPAVDELVELLLQRTRGNALFVDALARSLLEGGALVRTSQGWATRAGWDGAGVPQTVERVLAARVDVLAPDVLTVLQAAAVVGRSARLPLVADVVAPLDVSGPVEQLVAAGLVERSSDGDVPSVLFAHALLQDVVYGRLLRKHRRELHGRVARAALDLYGDGGESVDLLARHLYLAEAGEQAVEPLLRAGRRAVSLWANAQAVVHLERAREVLVALPDDGPRLDEVELQLGALHLLQGDAARAAEAYESVRVRRGLPEAWAGAMAAARAGADYAGVLDLFDRAGLDPSDPRHGPAWAECANALSLLGRFTDAVAMLGTALQALPADERALRGRLLTQLAYAEGQLRRHADATAHADEAVALLETTDDLRQLVAALRVAGMAHAYAGSVEQARARLDRGMSTAAHTGLLVEAAGCLLNSGLLVLDDAPGEAAERFRGALAQFERIGHAAGQVQSAGNLADALCRAGDLDAAQEAADAALERAVAIDHRLTVADVTATIAKVQLARGQAATATVTAERAAQGFLDLGDLADARACLELAARAAQDAGDEARARALGARALAVEGAGQPPKP